jgi:hypothetical protein
LPSEELLRRLRAFSLAGGEAAARRIRAVRTTERGEFRTAPGAGWMPFTAEQEIDATCSRFRWNARFARGWTRMLEVTDAYEQSRGYLAIRLGGVTVKKTTGPDLDTGELQRYLAAVSLCPPILLNHPSLEWTAAGPSTLRVRDGEATVDLHIGPDGSPIGFSAIRPRIEGKRAIPTPWSGTADAFRDWEGLRVPSHLEVSWNLPDGPFTYYKADLTSLEPA